MLMLKSEKELTGCACVAILRDTPEPVGGWRCGVQIIPWADTSRYKSSKEYPTTWVQRKSLFGENLYMAAFEWTCLNLSIQPETRRVSTCVIWINKFVHSNWWVLIFYWLFASYFLSSRSTIVHLYRYVTSTGEGLQNMTFELRGMFMVPHLL